MESETAKPEDVPPQLGQLTGEQRALLARIDHIPSNPLQVVDQQNSAHH